MATTGFIFDVPAVGVWPARETAWHSYSLRASLTFDSFFETHVISQNGNYQYQGGANVAGRDPLNHVMALLFVEPKFVREQMQQERAVSATWDENEVCGWFARAWFNNSGWCGKVSNASVW